MYSWKGVVLLPACVGLLLFAGCAKKGGGNASREGKAMVGWATDFPQGLHIAKKERKPIMVDFYTSWCKWCKVLEESTYATPQVAKFLGDLVCIRVNAEKDSLISQKYNIHGFPSILFLNPGGEEIDRIVGYLPPRDFIKEAKGILNGKDVFKVLLEREKKGPADIDLLYKVGEKFDDRGMYGEAKKRFARIVKLDPENKGGKSDDALFGIGRSYLAQKEYDKAIKEFNTLVSTYPQADLAADAQLYLGFCYEKKGNKDKAVVTYKKYLSDHPGADGTKWAKKRIKKLTVSEEKKGK